MGGSVQGIQFLPNGIPAFFDDTRFEIGFPPERTDAKSQQVRNGGFAGDFVF